ncbi:MAG: regulatory protein [Alphaproteobacteria bacterium]
MQACHLILMGTRTNRTGDDSEDMAPPEAGSGTQHRPRVPRKVTRSHLENVALAYLGRFAATSHSLEQVLMRRVWRSSRHHGDDPAIGAALIQDILKRYRASGLINDAAFAEARAKTLHQRGLPLRAIAQKLRGKGVKSDDIAAAITALAREAGNEDGSDEYASNHALDLAAARAYARRRRLGPWRAPDRRTEMHERDLATLARAGFSYGVARATLEDDGGND